MRVAFDVLPLLNNEKSGVGYYESELVKRLIRQNPSVGFDLEFISSKHNADGLKRYIARNVNVIHSNFSSFAYRAASSVLPVPYSAFIRSDADITHFFNFIVPPFVKGKTIATVHDMAVHRFPETVRAKTKYMLFASLKKSFKRADMILTVSEFSKREILRFYDYPEEKIRVVYNGVDLRKYNPQIGGEKIDETKAKYGLPEEYILYLGTLEPRKNIERLIDAYARVKANVPPLVLAGGKGWLYKGIFEKVKSLNLEKNVIFTGYIDGTDKPALYAGAMFFVFPSLYEGFGLPPLEAMACGTPLLVSNAASMPEVCGDCAVYTDPESVSEIAEGLKRLSGDKLLRNSLSAAGLSRAKLFDWDESARQVFKAYTDVL
ncbi:glycosyl transferase family 1 [Clostridia bacterium]|nr:glycosyl transferase family 1 [Clostridia bacterium]